MTSDIVHMGPHALAVHASRLQALKAYGISEHSLALNEESRLPVPDSKTKSIAKISKANRALAVQSEHELMVI
ncbi:MAG: hypothetical protein PHY14_03435 [Candidatus Gracilibacteria bacterium]|nr:hypothetical protein [Candidatus Gracilibacteria bacterium]